MSRRNASRAWLLGVFAAAVATFVLQLIAVTWASWSPVSGSAPMVNLPAAFAFANPIGITLVAWLIARFGPSWASSGVFDRRWNYAGFFLASTLVYLVLASLVGGLVQAFIGNPPGGQQLLYGFTLALLFTIFGGLPLWAFLSALAIGPRRAGERQPKV